jgi:hypothetical protein
MESGFWSRLFVVGPLVLSACMSSSAPSSPEISDRPNLEHGGRSEGSSAEGKAAETGGREDRVVVKYMLVRRVSDPPTEDFFSVTEETLEDPRGWQRAGFDLVRERRARYRIVLAEGPTVDSLCFPYETRSKYSCQNGPVVALNADRWRVATPKWTGSVDAYRRMLVNHEVGHLLGQHHPEIQCPEVGTRAPVMAQQSTELNGCLPNPWPLRREVRRAARHDLPLAPPYEED